MSHEMWLALAKACLETIYMVVLAGGVSTLLGLPLGVILFVTRPRQMLSCRWLNRLLAGIVNAFRSVPFIILLVAIIPFTRLIAGTSIGTNAAIVPLTVGAIPFVARIVENALQEVPSGLLEAGEAMGATPWQQIAKILIPESLSAIINGLTVMMVLLVSYSAMAGVVGGGGLGDLAIRYGYERFNPVVMLITVGVLIALVQAIQSLGDFLARRVDHR